MRAHPPMFRNVSFAFWYSGHLTHVNSFYAPNVRVSLLTNAVPRLLKLNPLYACFCLCASGRDQSSVQRPSEEAGLSSTPMCPPPPPPPLPPTLSRIKEVAPDHRWVILWKC